MNTQLPLPLKQHYIDSIIFSYRFRFLTTHQFQILLNHKYHSRVSKWLNELAKEKYLKQYTFSQQVTLPTMYSLGTKGRKYLLDEKNNTGIKVSKKLLERVWRENTYSDQFRRRCIFLTNLHLSLISLTKKTEATLHFYTKTDLYGKKYLMKELPDAFFSITEKTGSTKRYFLDVFDPYPNPKDLIKRVNTYFSYYKKSYWQQHNTNPFPHIILIAADIKTRNILHKKIQDKLNDELPLYFYLSTWEEIQKKGINKQVLYKVE